MGEAAIRLDDLSIPLASRSEKLRGDRTDIQYPDH
jgi:hypothetical protein